jgi:hypothetical protein
MSEQDKTIKDYIDEIRRATMTDVSPEKAVLLLQKLSALLGSVNEEWIDAEMAYNKYYEKMTNQYEKVSEARAKAKASGEYETKLRKEGLFDVTKELINSMKYVIKLKIDEKKESRFQT